jgi:hypothetical protein
MTRDSDAMTWKEKIASLTPPGRKSEQSPVRARIHANFDEIAAAKERGVTWQQLTDLFTSEGIVGADGEPLTADAVRSLFHSERYARGERRKRQPKKSTAQPQTQAPIPTRQPPPGTARDAVTFDPNDGAPADKPKPKFSGPAKPR